MIIRCFFLISKCHINEFNKRILTIITTRLEYLKKKKWTTFVKIKVVTKFKLHDFVFFFFALQKWLNFYFGHFIILKFEIYSLYFNF